MLAFRTGIVLILGNRFPGPLPEEIQQRLESQTDAALLEGWLDQASVAGSPAAWLDATR